jgi:hypothetical protein
MSDKNEQTLYMPIPHSSEIKAFTGVAANATALDKNAVAVRVYADQACYIEFEGTATAASTFLPAGMVEYFPVTPAGSTGMVISVIRQTNSGNLYITPMTQ